MARKVATRKSPEERRAQAEALQSSIAEQVEQLRSSEQWQRFLSFAQGFHSYSLSNVLLILAQCPTATRVAGFRQWQEKGRQVRKGEKAIRIFGYRKKKIADDTATEGEGTAEGEGERTVAYFPVLSVFDLGQTELIDPRPGTPPRSPTASREATRPGSTPPPPTTSPGRGGPWSGRTSRAARTGTR